MKKVILTKGLPASGKSTWAKKMLYDHPGRYKRISKDDLRAMLDNSRWSKANEQFILEVRDRLILLALKEGYHVIVDDTNLRPIHEERIRALVKGQANVEIQDFTHISVEECIQRDKTRRNYVGEAVIRKMYKEFLAPKAQVYAPREGLQSAVICDLDGTLALFCDRSPYDTAKCEDDILNPVVHSILASVSDHILLVSGRKEAYREQTERWLRKHNISYRFLFMRQNGDERKDAIIKHEIYKQYIEHVYNVRFILDDRNQVVEMWRQLGLIVLQVADGDF